MKLSGIWTLDFSVEIGDVIHYATVGPVQFEIKLLQLKIVTWLNFLLDLRDLFCFIIRDTLVYKIFNGVFFQSLKN